MTAGDFLRATSPNEDYGLRAELRKHKLLGMVQLEMEMYHKAKTRWIPVEERLPEEEVDVLIIDNDGCVYLTHLFRFNTGQWSWNNCVYATHWQPLPEPPTT